MTMRSEVLAPDLRLSKPGMAYLPLGIRPG